MAVILCRGARQESCTKAEASADREPPLTEQEQRMIEKNAGDVAASCTRLLLGPYM